MKTISFHSEISLLALCRDYPSNCSLPTEDSSMSDVNTEGSFLYDMLPFSTEMSKNQPYDVYLRLVSLLQTADFCKETTLFILKVIR